MNIKTGDLVRVIAGKEKGKEGKVLQVFPDLEKLVIEGLNMAVRHVRSRRRDVKGQQVRFPSPIHRSNVMLMSSKTKKVGRVGSKILTVDGVKKKVRVIRIAGVQEEIE